MIKEIDISNNKKREWAMTWNTITRTIFFGRIIAKDSQNNKVLLQHYNYNFENNNISASLQDAIIEECSGCKHNQNNVNTINNKAQKKKFIYLQPCKRIFNAQFLIKIDKIYKKDNKTLVKGFKAHELLCQQSYRDAIECGNETYTLLEQNNNSNFDILLNHINNNQTKIRLKYIRNNISNEKYLTFWIDGQTSTDTYNQINITWIYQHGLIYEEFIAKTMEYKPNKIKTLLYSFMYALILIDKNVTSKFIFKNQIIVNIISKIISSENIDITFKKSQNERIAKIIRAIWDFKKLNSNNIRLVYEELTENDSLNAKTKWARTRKMYQQANDLITKTTFSLKFLNNNFVTMKYNNINIDNNEKFVIKQIRDTFNYNKFLTGSRANQYITFDKENEIDWIYTWNNWNKYDAGSFMHQIKNKDGETIDSKIYYLKTSFKKSKLKHFSMKLIMNELPTIDKMMKRYPKLYKNWTCVEIGCSELETNNHIITCKARRHVIRNILNNTETNLINNILENTNMDISILTEKVKDLKLFSFTNDKTKFDALSLLKGLIPKKLVSLLKNIQLDHKTRLEIINKTYQQMLENLYQKVWLIRCDNVINEEKEQNIFKKDKRKHVNSKDTNQDKPNNEGEQDPQVFSSTIEGNLQHNHIDKIANVDTDITERVENNRCSIT
jgi:hypothetical protein